MTRYTITIVMETPYNPAKWDWDELIASEPGEEIELITVDKGGPDDPLP